MAVIRPSQMTGQTASSSRSLTPTQASSAVQSNVKQGQLDQIRSLTEANPNASNRALLSRMESPEKFTSTTTQGSMTPRTVSAPGADKTVTSRDVQTTRFSPLGGQQTTGTSSTSGATGGTTKPKPFSTASIISESARGGLTPPEETVTAAQQESERKLYEGTEAFQRMLDSSLKESGETALANMDRLTSAFEQADNVLEQGIGDIQASTRTLSDIYREGAEISRDVATNERESAMQRLDAAQDTARENFSSAIDEQRQSVIDQRVRDETFAGLRGQFGSSARMENIDRAEQQGRGLLTSLQKSAARSEEEFSLQGREIGEKYLTTIRGINNESDTKLQTLFRDTQKEIQRIQENRATNSKEKALQVNAVVNRLEDRQNAIADAKAGAVLDLNKTLSQNVIALKKELFNQEQTRFQDLQSERGFFEGVRQFEEGQTLREAQFEEQQQQFAQQQDLRMEQFEQQKVDTQNQLTLAKEKLAQDKENAKFQKDVAQAELQMKKISLEQDLINQRKANVRADEKLALDTNKFEFDTGRQLELDAIDREQRDIQNSLALSELGLDKDKQELAKKKLDLEYDKFAAEERKASEELNNTISGDLSSLELSASQKDNITGSQNIIQTIPTLDELLDSVDTGPVVGLKQRLKAATGFEVNEDFVRLDSKLTKITAQFMKAISGAAVNESEVKRLSRFLPNVTDSKHIIKTKVESLAEEMMKIRDDTIRAGGGDPQAIFFQEEPSGQQGAAVPLGQATADDFF